MAQTYETTWLGQPALALETPSLRLVTVPGMGAKIVSLFDKQANREWLLPPAGRAFAPVEYGARFVDQDMSGWDEMFPTIDACAYPIDSAYHGAALPDHGEVWALPWHIDGLTENKIRLSTAGRALPYRLTRTLRAADDQHISVEFEAVNTGAEPFVALWAAHPQFAADEQTRIVLPDAAARVVNVHRAAEWPDAGRLLPWPVVQSPAGRHVRLDRVGAASLRACRKVYLPPDAPVSWAALQQGDAGDWIRLSWDAREVPYLGIWVDEGTYNALPTAALEPSTGYYDRLDFAWRNDAVMRLPPNEPVCWHMDIEIGSEAITPTGE